MNFILFDYSYSTSLKRRIYIDVKTNRRKIHGADGDKAGVKNSILDEITLDIPDGRYIVVTGPNGGGKPPWLRLSWG